MPRLTDQKYLRLLRLASPQQVQEFTARLQRGFEQTKIRRWADGKQISIYMEKHDSVGNFAIVIEPSGAVRGGRIRADGTAPEGVKRYS